MPLHRVSLTLSTPFARSPMTTAVYVRNAQDAPGRIAATIRRYAERVGVAVAAVDYECRWDRRASA